MIEGELVRGLGLLYILSYKNFKRYIKGRRLLSMNDLNKKLECSSAYNSVSMGFVIKFFGTSVIVVFVLLLVNC